jgi:hypothetical protein
MDQSTPRHSRIWISSLIDIQEYGSVHSLTFKNMDQFTHWHSRIWNSLILNIQELWFSPILNPLTHSRIWISPILDIQELWISPILGIQEYGSVQSLAFKNMGQFNPWHSKTLISPILDIEEYGSVQSLTWKNMDQSYPWHSRKSNPGTEGKKTSPDVNHQVSDQSPILDIYITLDP